MRFKYTSLFLATTTTITLSVIILSLGLLSSFIDAAASPLSMSQRVSLQLAVSNAMKNMASTNEWKYALSSSSIEFSNIGECVPEQSYPKTLDLPNDNTIVLCKNNDATIPWITSKTTGYYFTFVDLLIKELNRQYSKTFKTEWVDVDVSTSYFPPLRDAVNNGVCHMVISYTTINSNRSSEVDFGCAHSAGRSSILRSALESDRTLDTLDKLSDPTVNVGAVKGSVNIRPQNANITLVSSIEEGFEMIKNQQLHAFLFTEVTVNSWVRDNCAECKVYPYGTVAQYAVFFEQGAELTGGGSHQSVVTVVNQTSVFILLVLTFVLYLF